MIMGTIQIHIVHIFKEVNQLANDITNISIKQRKQAAVSQISRST